MSDAPEQRSIDVDVNDLDTRGNRVVGYAAVYGPLSDDLGGFRERIAPGAFTDVLSATPDVRALLNHDPDQILGRTKSGTLRLEDDQRGLRFELDLPESPIGQNVREAVKRGDLDGASFRFKVGGESWSEGVRTVETVKELQDVSLATTPAYPAASVELRNRQEPEGESIMTEETAVVEEATDEAETTEERTAPVLTTDQVTVSETRDLDRELTEATLAVRPGESRALTTSVSIAPEKLSSHLFDKLRPESVALRSGINVITTDKHKVTFPTLTADVGPGWYAEAAQITPGDPTLSTVSATPKKLAHLTIFSNEVIEDSDPSAIDVVRQNLLKRMALSLDLAIFEGTGQNNQPSGLSVIANTGGSSAVGSIATNKLAPFGTAIADLEKAGARPGAFVVAPAVWAAVRKLEDGQNRPTLNPVPTGPFAATLYGVPVYVSGVIKADGGSGNDESILYAYDPSEVYLVRRTEIQIEVDRSFKFDTDQTVMRARMRADLLVPNPTAVWIGKKTTP